MCSSHSVTFVSGWSVVLVSVSVIGNALPTSCDPAPTDAVMVSDGPSAWADGPTE